MRVCKTSVNGLNRCSAEDARLVPAVIPSGLRSKATGYSATGTSPPGYMNSRI